GRERGWTPLVHAPQPGWAERGGAAAGVRARARGARSVRHPAGRLPRAELGALLAYGRSGGGVRARVRLQPRRRRQAVRTRDRLGRVGGATRVLVAGRLAANRLPATTRPEPDPLGTGGTGALDR